MLRDARIIAASKIARDAPRGRRKSAPSNDCSGLWTRISKRESTRQDEQR